MPSLAVLGGSPVRTEPFPRYPVLGEEEIAAATAVIQKQSLCSARGSEVRNFESEFAEYCGARFAVATSSGTTALHAALAAAGVGVGHEVIVPPYTFLSTATSVIMQNAVPVFADIERDTLGLDPRSVAEKVTSRTRAIIVVHMNGYPADLDGLMQVAREHGLIVIEDCAHAHGAEHHGRKVGTVGHLGAFSFQQKKNLSLGEGGMVISSDQDLAEKARGFCSFGKLLPMAFNYRMTELHGAIGRVRLRRLDEGNAQRIRNARYLDEELRDLRGIKPQQARPDTKTVYYNYVLRYHEEEIGVTRSRFIEALEAEGIPVPQIYHPLYRHATFRMKNAYGRGCPFACPFYDVADDARPRYEEGLCPVAEEICDRRSLELKVHPSATLDDMADIATAIKKVLSHIDELKGSNR